MLALYGIGNIVGAGVYVLVGKIAEPAGYLSVLAFLVAALVAFCAALCYAELAARFPVSAGISVYLHEAFKAKHLSTAVGLLLVLAGTISTATLLKGFSGYFTSFVSIDPRIAIGGVVLILLAVMLRGIKESVGAAALLTVIEVGGLLFLMAAILLAAHITSSTPDPNLSDTTASDTIFDVLAGTGQNIWPWIGGAGVMLAAGSILVFRLRHRNRPISM